MNQMTCVVCGKPIVNFDPRMHQLKLDEGKTVEICANCIHAFMKWQQGIFATLYPTKMAKKLVKVTNRL